MPLPESIDGTKYGRKRGRNLRVGDIVPVEQIATGKLIERTLVHLESIPARRGECLALRYDTGAVDQIDPQGLIYFRCGSC